MEHGAAAPAQDLPYKRVLVTGGAGFIGSRLVSALAAGGREVVVLDDLSTGLRASVSDAASLVQTDISDPATVALVADVRPELIIHAAAQVSVPRSVVDPDRDREVNLRGTQNVLQGARQAETRRFVFISSGGAIYGESKSADEDSPPAPANPYGKHKLAAEQEVKASGLPYGIVRYANVYGPGQRSDLEGGVVSIFVDALREGRPITIFGSGEQVRDLLYVDDAVSAALVIAAASASGTWNVGTGSPTSVHALLDRLTALIAPATEVRYAPPRPGDVSSSSLSIDRIRQGLRWNPRYSLADGLVALLRDS